MGQALEGRVARLARTAEWSLVRGAEAVASAHATCRPDGRWFVSIDGWDEAADAPLLAAMVGDLRHDLHTNVDGADEVELRRWHRLGFEPSRRESLLAVPVDPGVSGLTQSVLPDGIVLVSADAVDETTLRELDDTLRADVPGSAGWVNDPMEFREYTFDERQFDPATYLVAVDDACERFAGLVRVWTTPRLSRLGLIGVTAPYRRRGLARALLAGAFAPLHERGVRTVAAQVDVTNTASVALLNDIGAEQVGETIELVRPRPRT
ncbi:MAG: GNAT family N-acetyltransferase [Geodermatophilaceae bacterium]